MKGQTLTGVWKCGLEDSISSARGKLMKRMLTDQTQFLLLVLVLYLDP